MVGGKCPFGYTAEDDSEDGADDVGSEAHAGVDEPRSSGTNIKSRKPEEKVPSTTAADVDGKKSKKNKAPSKFDADTDPVSWFYQNQIKSEEEFQAKKEVLRTEAKKRLEQIMDKKNKRLLWPSDSEFDDLSLSSGELSELDSGVHSLASLRSCAFSWIENSRYGSPAAMAVKWASMAALVCAGAAMYTSFMAMQNSRQLPGVVAHGQTPTYAFLVGLALSTGAGLSLLAGSWRSKRLLLCSQVMYALVYAAAVVMGMLVWMQPMTVDTKIFEHACKRTGSGQEYASRLCTLLPIVKEGATHGSQSISHAMIAAAGISLLLLALNSWFTIELCFIEKKAVKHVRRHKRNKHTIPWEKIKIVGPVTNCGASAGAKPGAAGRPGSGKCPVMPYGAKDKAM